MCRQQAATRIANRLMLWSPNQSISLDGANDAESAIHKLTPEIHPRRMYENYTAYDTVGAVKLTRAALIDSLNKGWGLMHHVGHGFRKAIADFSQAVDRRWQQHITRDVRHDMRQIANVSLRVNETRFLMPSRTIAKQFHSCETPNRSNDSWLD